MDLKDMTVEQKIACRDAIGVALKKGKCAKCKKKIYPDHWMWEKDGEYYHECCKPEGAVKVR